MTRERTKLERFGAMVQPNGTQVTKMRSPVEGSAARQAPGRDAVRVARTTRVSKHTASASSPVLAQAGNGRGHVRAGKLEAAILSMATAVLVLAAPPSIPLVHAQELPKVSIAADQAEHGLGIDDVTFTLTRTGPSDAELGVDVSLMQDQMYLPEDLLSWQVTFEADSTSAELSIQKHRFETMLATQSGNLHAVVQSSGSYMVGRPMSASTRMVALNPAITVRIAEPGYRHAEGASDPKVAIVARTEAGLTRPNREFTVALSTRQVPDGATSPADYRALSEQVLIGPEDFMASGAVWEARRQVALTIINDTEVEPDEAFDMLLERTPDIPDGVALRDPDGTACPQGGCRAEVVIADDDGVPVPTVTIAPAQDAYGFGIDDVTFTLTRTGASDAELDVAVSLTQDAMFLPESELSHTVTMSQGDTSAVIMLERTAFTSGATQTGTLTATVNPGTGYEAGSPGFASTRMVVKDPAMTVRPAEATYRFAEGSSEGRVVIVARTEPDLPRPNRDLDLSLHWRSQSGGATIGADFETPGGRLVIASEDFIATGGVWEARKELAFAIVDDSEIEPDETFEVGFFRGTLLPRQVVLRQADGSACAADGCFMHVTILDDDGVPSAPRNLSFVPGDQVAALFWEASADSDGQPVTKHQYRVSPDAGTTWTPNWRDIPYSAPGDGQNAVSYLVSGLTNGTEYTFEVRAVNDVGGGEATRGTTTPTATGTVRGICNRTPAVRERLLVLLSLALTPGYAGDCAGVSDAWLARLTSVQLIAPHDRLTSLKPGDFAGLPRVRSVYITDQSQLTVLPTGVFDGLAGVEEFWIFENGIGTVSAGAFRDLPRLRDLHLADNRISRLAPGAFTGLPSLEKLVLYRNRVTTFPFDEFEALPALRGLFITDNPGHAHGVEVSESSVKVPLGGSASYRLRLTASPSIEGTRVGVATETQGVGVSPEVLSFTNEDWFRLQEVTVSAPEDGPSGDGAVTHEVLSGNYAHRMAGPPPQVRLWVGPMRQARSMPGLSVADARAREGVDSTIDFVVTIDHAGSQTIAVDYATLDGTAKSGEDYTRTFGSLTFGPGERKKTVRVPVLDDAKDEGEETFTLTLSRASGAGVARATATGTIVNDDPMPRAWLARFGRTVAGQAVDAVSARLAGTPEPYVMVGGMRFGAFRSEQSLQGGAGEPWERERGRTFAPSTHALLAASAFHLRSDGNGNAPALSAWGRVATGGFDAEVDGVRMDGHVTSAIVGADVERDRVLAGAAVSFSRGDGGFASTRARASSQERGKIESTLTSVLPYAQVRLSERTSVWAMAGVGSGELTLDEEGGTPIQTDITMRMGAIGARGILLLAPESGGLELSVKSDAFWVRMKSDAVRSKTAGNLEASQADATRVRLALEGERVFPLARGGTFTPTFEVGARHDGGDAENGTGLELGTGVRYGAGRVAVEGSVRTLVAHEEGDYEEWGASGSVRVAARPSGRGLSLTVAPSLGAASSGLERLWQQPNASGFERNRALGPRSRLETELGYGLRAPIGHGVMTPYTGFSLTNGGAREMRVGARWALAPNAGMGLEASRSGTREGTSQEAIRLRIAMRW